MTGPGVEERKQPVGMENRNARHGGNKDKSCLNYYFAQKQTSIIGDRL